jgi:hypothetical protein
LEVKQISDRGCVTGSRGTFLHRGTGLLREERCHEGKKHGEDPESHKPVHERQQIAALSSLHHVIDLEWINWH